MKANNSSFGTAVENAGLVTEVLGDVLSVEVTTSIATPGGGDGFTVRVAVWVAPYVPDMTTAVLVATTLVVIVNVAEVAPEEIVTLGGTVATVGLLLCNCTVAPPAGAAADRCTVPVDEAPPTRVLGFKVTDAKLVGFIVSAEDLVVA